MKQHIKTAKDFIVERNELFIGLTIVLGLVLLTIVIALLAYNSVPKVVYQPTKACDLLTTSKAKELLGDGAIRGNATDPVQTENIATSKCAYSDSNPDVNSMLVAAVIVRSGINDAGVEQNKTEFKNGKPTEHAEAVKGLGDDAYFNQERGQLNILNGRNWIILSNGVGSAPESNTVEKTVELAQKVLH